MPIPLFTLKEDMSMYEEFKFLEAWAEWDIPEGQQLMWLREFFVHVSEMENLMDIKPLIVIRQY